MSILAGCAVTLPVTTHRINVNLCQYRAESPIKLLPRSYQGKNSDLHTSEIVRQLSRGKDLCVTSVDGRAEAKDAIKLHLPIQGLQTEAKPFQPLR